MARMGHDGERAALIYQHQARDADAAITNAIDAHVDAQRAQDDRADAGPTGPWDPQANATRTNQTLIKIKAPGERRLGSVRPSV
jgi:hypothetical protein